MYIELQAKKAQVFDLKGNILKDIELPIFFSYPVRKDIIRRAFLSEFTKSLQPKGRDPMAGKRTSALSFGINLGMARVPRVKTTGEAALAPNTVGGRVTFPPSPEKRIKEEINEKEKRLATISALSATTDVNLVKQRGHLFSNEKLPIILTDDIIKMTKTKEILEVFESLKISEDIERVKEKIRIRSGKGKMRGRRYKTPKGPLIVIHENNPVFVKAASNIAGVDVVTAQDLSVLHLAPGGHPGRLTLYTQSSIDVLRKRFDKRLVIWSLRNS